MKPHRDLDSLPLWSPDVLGRLLLLVSATALALATVMAILCFQERGHEQKLMQQQGEQRIDQEYDFLTGQIQAVCSDVLYLARQPLLRRFLAGDRTALAELKRDYVRFAELREVYDQIRFLDTSGQEMIRINFRGGKADVVPDDELQAKADRYYYIDAKKLGEGEVFMSQFDLNVEHGEIQRPLEPVLRFLTPVFDNRGTKRGLFALNYSGNHLLHRFNEVTLPGATLLVNSEGGYIYGPTSEDAWGWLLGHERSFRRQFPEEWKQVAGKVQGRFSTSRGFFTFRQVPLSHFLPVPNRPSSELEPPAPITLISFMPSQMQHAGSWRLFEQLMLMNAGAMLLLTTLGWYWARSAAIRKQQARAIVASESRLRLVSDQLLVAQEEERRKISRELHDELGQQVTAINLGLRSAKQQSDRSRQQTLLAQAIEGTEQLLTRIHQLASEVRPSVLDDLGLHDAVETLLADFEQRTGIDVTAGLEFDGHAIPRKIGENVYRILQEALSNAAKHARVKQVEVRIEVHDRSMELSVSDAGVGFDAQAPTPRLGLLGMQERVELLHGRFELTSAPRQGTHIQVWLPLEGAGGYPATVPAPAQQ